MTLRMGSRTFWFLVTVLGERPSRPLASQSCAACWLVGPGFEDFHAAGDDVAGADGRLEVPVHVEEDGPRAGEALRRHRVEDGAGDAALDDDLAEP